MTVRRGTITVMAVAALGISAVAASPAHADRPGPSADPYDLPKKVKVQNVTKHLSALQEAADANGGNRAAGSPGYEASASYVEDTLHKAGYETTRQPFNFTYQEVLDTKLAVTAPAARDLEHTPMSYSPSTPDAGISAALAVPTQIQGCDAAAYNGADVTGKIVLVQRGTCSFGEKSLAGGAAGAAAVLIYNNEDGALDGTLGEVDPKLVPTTGLTRAEGEKLAGEVAAGPVSVTFVLKQLIEERTSFNVIAETAEGNPDNVVMLGAHLDSVQHGPGINDNGSGSAAILETAVQLGKQRRQNVPLNNKVRFAWWSAEEVGLVGSTHYVNDLVENDPAEIDKLATYLNFDMIGSPNYTIGVYDADESTFPAPVEVPEGSVAAEKIFTDWFDSKSQPWVDSEFSGRSDYQAFIENGVASTGLFTGAEVLKTEEEAKIFGGTAGVALDKNYHAKGDDISNINLRALDINTDALAHAAGLLAHDTSLINGVAPADPGKGKKNKKAQKVDKVVPHDLEAA